MNILLKSPVYTIQTSLVQPGLKLTQVSFCRPGRVNIANPGGTRVSFPGGGHPYKKGGDARRKISIEPLKGTNLGVA